MSQIKENKTNVYWKSLSEKEQSSELDSFVHNEFPDGTVELAETMTRKKFLSLMGASMAMAGLVGCRKPVQKILPYIHASEEIVPGIPNYYASSMPFGINSYGIVIESNEGRPTHIEGNELHPSSKGSTNTYIQASILDLYDPDRLKEPLNGGVETDIASFKAYGKAHFEAIMKGGGENLAILSNSFNSYTTKAMYEDFFDAFPKADWVVFDPISNENHISGLELFTDTDSYATYEFDKANVILSIESDFLGNDLNSIHNQKTFSKKRKVKHSKAKMNRLYSIESNLTVTGMMADHRFKIKPSNVYSFIAELNNSLKKNGLNKLKSVNINNSNFTDAKSMKFINVLAKDLIKNKSKSVITVGDDCDKTIHSLVFIINHALLNNNNTVRYHTLNHSVHSNNKELENLINKIKNKEIWTLVILDVDFYYLLAHNFGGMQKLSSLLSEVNVIYLGSHHDKTSQMANWSIPKSHYLESWSDATSIDGSMSIVQPMISPLHNSLTMNELLSIIVESSSGVPADGSSGKPQNDYDILRDSWKKMLGGSFSSKWNKTVHDGYYKNSSGKFNLSVKSPSQNAVIRVYKDLTNIMNDNKHQSLELRFSPSSQVYDGRYINNYWLREQSDPVTKISWENVALISYRTSKVMKLNNSNIISISVNNKRIEVPVWVLPGLPDDTVVLELGYGRELSKSADRNYIDEDLIGSNVYPLKSFTSNFTVSATISNTGKSTKVACTQDHHGLDFEKLAADEIDNRLPEIIREANIEEFRKNEDFVLDYDRKKHIPDDNSDMPSMYPSHDYSESPQWGMNIDLNVCSGCNACSIACQSENNIPVVGKQQVYDGREMSWIRMDRYFKGDVDNPEFALQPVACVHCENAPCEQVCPVAATTHDDEGLNGMTYNRCIGTRYCANNCPYKVRRFNFFNYTYDTPELVKMANNPDVTVRFRGVMEKCTYCVQRISGAKISAKNEKRSLTDGDVKVACQNACAMDAITFGDITDSNSEVSKAKTLSQDYALLKELNTLPRTTYLAKFRNPHPDLDDHTYSALSGEHH